MFYCLPAFKWVNNSSDKERSFSENLINFLWGSTEKMLISHKGQLPCGDILGYFLQLSFTHQCFEDKHYLSPKKSKKNIPVW